MVSDIFAKRYPNKSRREAITVATLQDRIESAALLVRGLIHPSKIKSMHELWFWQGVARRENGNLTNDHYEWFYTSYFSLTPEDYKDRRILDIGCGPRGSLEWAEVARERVGLDPLVDQYRRLGIDRHKMTYVNSGSESIPFEDGYFDIVTSLNSLDHVDDLEKTTSEIGRVTASGGLLLIISDVNHVPTPTEPVSFSWNILDRFTDFDIIESRELEKPIENGVYTSVKAGVPYDHADPRQRYGIITAKLRRH
jgi:SAM-dependent methyltransferase